MAHKMRLFTRAMGTDLPEYVALNMPSLSPTMEVGSIAEWYVKEGDEIEEGTALAGIVTVCLPRGAR